MGQCPAAILHAATTHSLQHSQPLARMYLRQPSYSSRRVSIPIDRFFSHFSSLFLLVSVAYGSQKISRKSKKFPFSWRPPVEQLSARSRPIARLLPDSIDYSFPIAVRKIKIW